MTHTLSRRGFVLGSAALLVACERRAPDTPLAHLYGKQWVNGAYAYYADGYAHIETGAEAGSDDAYRVLAQKGINALADLQTREVPFYIRVSPAGDGFHVEREVPERLTFSADMTDAQRQAATRAWQSAREHIQTDYTEVQRLDWALGRLLSEVSRVRSAIDHGRLEQYKLCRQIGQLQTGGAPPFELPYKVTRLDYQSVVELLLIRLESDRQRLERLESEMVAVGLVARSTDSSSASLSDNLAKVLVTIVQDRQTAPPPAETTFPASADERTRLITGSRALRAKIVHSDDYKTWLAREEEKEDTLGQLLAVVDQMTGLGASRVYREVMRIWRGNADYLEYLKLAAALVPPSTGLSGVLDQAVDTTERTRRAVAQARGIVARAEHDANSGALAIRGEGLVNVATRGARRSLDRQLVFLHDTDERDSVRDALRQGPLGSEPMPAIPSIR